MRKSSRLKFTEVLWAVCLAVGILVLTVETGHAHDGMQPTIDAISVGHDAIEHAEGVVGHCHGGASCGVSAILILTDGSHINMPADSDLHILHQSLDNLVTHSFEPPPPRPLS